MAINISASLLNDYMSCSQKAYYRIFRSEVAVPNKSMIMGSIVHNVIEKHWDNQNKALALLEKKANDSSLGYELPNLKHFVYTYFENFSKFMTKKDLIEKFFKLKMDDDVFLVGKLDRISNNVIYDWKTTANPPRSLENDVQFIIYRYAYNKLYRKPPVAAFYASLAKGRLIPYSYNDFYFNELFNVVIPKVVEDIRSGAFAKEGLFRKGVCHFCSYKGDCLKELKHGMASGSFAKK